MVWSGSLISDARKDGIAVAVFGGPKVVSHFGRKHQHSFGGTPAQLFLCILWEAELCLQLGVLGDTCEER